MNTKKEDVLRFLSDIRSYYATYHNHKEASAWAGIVLFSALISKIATYFGEEPSLACGVKTLETISVLGLLTLALLFVFMQFKSRRSAANLAAASLALTAKFVFKKEEEILSSDFAVMSSDEKDQQAPHVLPKIVLDKAKEVDTLGSGTRKKLEWVGYLVLFGSAVLALVRIWWPN